MNGGGNKSDVAVHVSTLENQLVRFTRHVGLGFICHHERGRHSVAGNHLQRTASRDVARGHGDEPFPRVGRQVFTLRIERAVFGEPCQGPDRGQGHFIAVDIDQTGCDGLEGAGSNQQRLLKHKGVWRTCRDGDGGSCLQLIESYPCRNIAELFSRPRGLAKPCIGAIDVPHHGGWTGHTIAAPVQDIRREGRGLEDTEGQPSDFNGRGNTRFDTDVVAGDQAVVFGGDFRHTGRPRVKQSVIRNAAVARRPVNVARQDVVDRVVDDGLKRDHLVG